MQFHRRSAEVPIKTWKFLEIPTRPGKGQQNLRDRCYITDLRLLIQLNCAVLEARLCTASLPHFFFVDLCQ